MIHSREQILELMQENRDHIKDFGVRQIGLFGSYARGDQKAGSDVDLLVVFDKNQKSYRHFFYLSEYLESLFHRDVDMLTDKGVSPHFKTRIVNEIIYVPISH